MMNIYEYLTVFAAFLIILAPTAMVALAMGGDLRIHQNDLWIHRGDLRICVVSLWQRGDDF